MATASGMRYEMEFRRLESLGPRWGWMLTIGVALIVMGILSLSMSVFTTIATVFAFGVIMLIAGIVQGVLAFSSRQWSGFFLQLLACLLYLFVAFTMMFRPAESAISLTLLLSAIFMVSGVFRLIGSIAMRFPRWGWSALSGVVNIALAVIILMALPESGLWVIGTLLGVELIVHGSSLAALAIAIRGASDFKALR